MARTRATARHSQGWYYLVEQLAAAPDRDSFARRMLDLQCKVVAAEYGAVWMAGDEGKPALVCAWPENVASAQTDDNPVMRALTQAAASGFEHQFSHVLTLDDSPSSTPGVGAHAFVTVLRRRGTVEAVVTAVAHVADAQVIQSTAAVREVAEGLYDGFEARQDAAEQRRDLQRVRRAMALLAVCQEAPGFRGSCLNLVNELAQQIKCSRVSLGHVRGRQVKLIAMSDTENLKRHSERVALTELAMSECLDQQQPIVYPLPEQAEPLLAQAVVYAHRRMVDPLPGRHVLSVPLRDGDQWLGVVTLERSDEPFDADTVRQLQLFCDVITPHLADRRRGDRFLPVHAWHSVRNAAAFVVGPRQVAWKLAGIAVIAAIVYALVGTWPYRIGAPFTIEAQHRQMVSAPFKGAIDSVAIKEGDPVPAGTVLAQLETYRLRLRLDAETAQRDTAQQDIDQARSAGDSSAVNRHTKRLEQHEAQIALLHHQIDSATLVSPIDGVLLAGQWYNRIGGVVELGQAMFEIAPLDGSDDLVAVLHVTEHDIDQLRLARRAAQRQGLPVTGEIATRSEPGRTYAIEIERIIPMAAPVEGVNGFEVRCRIADPTDLRPNMQGIAKLNAGPKNIAWIMTHRIADTLRLWLWY